MRKTSLYVSVVVTLAVAAALCVYHMAPSTSASSVRAVLLLALLAVVAEWLGFVLPRSASGSISFIPYLAAVVAVPGWPTVVAAALVRTALELAHRKAPAKLLFNVATIALTESLAIMLFRTLGGTSILAFSGAALTRTSIAIGAPALISFTAALVTNTILVSGVVGVSTGQPMLKVWRDNTLATIGLDIAAGPLVFVFAWVYASFGPIAAASLWVPILGLRQVYKTNLDLERTNQELLQLMVKSIEARDPYTSGHSRRVQHHSIIIARAIGLNEREIERVSRAALLHDVGKIYEKYAPILRKADKLTPDEWATMQEHPIDGANLVATMSGLHDVVPAVRHHHERWDGTGYPDGLAGEAIPLASRIITFADTIDAMTSERPYRRPLTEDEVKQEILRCRSRQFDPRIADRLLASPAWHLLFDPPTRISPRFGLSLIPAKEQRRARVV